MESYNHSVSNTVTQSIEPELPTGLPDNEVFEVAVREMNLGRYAAIRAYFWLIPGLEFGKCHMCSEIGFLMPSGLKGWTCTRCEQAHNEETKRLSEAS